jgi:hypothetical protein
MDEPKDNFRAEAKASRQIWRELPFDAATNFSLLGWLLGKFSRGNKAEEKIDLTLEE